MTSEGPSVTFRVDASRAIGLGHLRRCLTLADALRGRGCATRIVCSEPFAPSVAVFVGPHRVSCIGEALRAARGGPVDEQQADAAATLAVIGAGDDASWVVVDNYKLGVVWERAVSAAGHRVMVIDDFRDRRHHADLLISDAELPFDGKLNECDGARALVGRRYTLIGPEYAYRTGAVPRRDSLQLLISYGGTDPTGETAKALAAIETLLDRGETRHRIARVDVVVGQLNACGDEIAAAARRIACARVHVSPAGLAPLLDDADLFLTAGGNSMAEALALRKPCLVTVTADNQRLMVEELAADGIVRVVGTHDGVGVAEVAAAIAKTCADIAVFAERVAARAVFDHLGAGRIADAMLSARSVVRQTKAQTAAGRRFE